MADLTAFEANINHLLDLEALREVLLRYCRGVDRCDQELILSAFHADAYDDHADFFQGSAVDFAPWVIELVQSMGRTQHVLTNARFEIDEDVAYGESYVAMRVAGPGAPHPDAFARYVDRFERRDGEWRIAFRRLVNEWNGAGPADYDGSRRDRLDPSYTIAGAKPGRLG